MAEKYEYSDKIKFPLFRGAFVNLFASDTNGKFGVTAIYDNAADLQVLKGAMAQAAQKCWGDKWKDMVKHPKFRKPIKDGEEIVTREGELYEGFESGQQVIKITTNQRPGVVDARARPIKGADGETITDRENGTSEVLEENQAFSGCYFQATGCAQAYDRDDGFGISFKLDNVQLVRQGERLGGGGRVAAEDDFEPVAEAAGGGSGGGSSDDVF